MLHSQLCAYHHVDDVGCCPWCVFAVSWAMVRHYLTLTIPWVIAWFSCLLFQRFINSSIYRGLYLNLLLTPKPKLNPFTPESFLNGFFQLWIWTYPLLQTKNRIANRVDETAHHEPFYLDLHCLQRYLYGWKSSMWLDTLCRFQLYFTREATFVTSSLLSSTLGLFWKGVCFQRKEFAPKGSKFFPLREDSFSEGRQKDFDRVASLKVYFSS